MHPMDGLAKQVTWASTNIAYNLDFIPDDKLDWKPAPTAKSALEIINHSCAAISSMTDLVEEKPFGSSESAASTDKAGAKAAISATGKRYADSLQAMDPARLEGTAELPFGPFPMAMAVAMPAIDLCHHHGQIAYIQELLGDEQDHFAGM